MKKTLLMMIVMLGCVLTACTEASRPVAITPAPLSYEQGRGFYEWNTPTTVSLTDEGMDADIIQTAFETAGLPVQLEGKAAGGKKGVRLERVRELPGVAATEEAYRLEVTSSGVTVQACTDAGFFYAIQTLAQLADMENGKVQAAVVTDAPRFAYRGIMLDVSRHFRSKDFVMKQMDLMAAYKMNRLHLHLTDAAGWRLQIDRYPRLTQLAAWRPQETWKDWWEKNGRQYCEQESPEASGGFYTKEDVREMLEYARRRCITIIPEIEMPSHSEEVLTAYPELSCTHEPYKQSDFCVGNEKTFEFLENVLTEVMELFPSKYIHIGGDEAGKASWKTCPLCLQRMKKEGLKDVDELQSYLIRRIEKFLNANGRDLLGWDEILEGGLAPNATVMSWRGVEGGLKAIRSGHHAIMSPGGYCYLDSYQDAPFSQPEAIGGYLPLERVYSYEPVPDSMTVEEARLLLGVQANLWTEYIPTAEHAEYMLYPRAIAVAEVGWTQPENKSWPSFRQRVLTQVLPQMQAKGYHPFDYSQEIGNRPEAQQPIEHLAVGKKVKFLAPNWKNYPANGEETLTDGLRGGWNYSDGRWMAFITDKRVDAIVDLEEETVVHSIGADFMQICGPGVFFPKKVIISVSTDGENYTQLAEIDHEVVKDDVVSFKNFGWTGEAKARYIHYQSFPEEKYGGVHFVDEIVVE